MRYKTHTTYTIPVFINGVQVDAEVKSKPSEADIDPVYEAVDDRLMLAYAIDDMDASNPLDDQYGMGAIYTARRGASREHHRSMQSALGLNEDWHPDLSGFDEEDEDAALAAWTEARKNGTVGDKYAVPLDCYEHGGEMWSVSGSGMQDRFDTSRSAGVWVPDDCAREEADRRAKVYAFGEVVEVREPGKKPQYIAQFDTPDASGPSQIVAGHPKDEWHQAFEDLEAYAKTQVAPGAVRRRLGETRAAIELAKEALVEYNAWLAGETYGIATAEFVIEEDRLVPAPPAAKGEVWGYVGRDNMSAALREEVADMVNGHEYQKNQAAGQKG